MTGSLRQVVHAQGRALHLRRFGAGPPVVLLHESPRSSAVLEPLARVLAADFTVLGLDTPGYGLSTALPLDRPGTGDFADAVAASLRTLGLPGPVPVYGTHTGATIAVALAARHPDLVAGAVLDGYPVFGQAERDNFAHLYLRPFEPAWDGGTVARLWSRVRDQYSFFPWYLPGESSRLGRTPPDPAAQTAVIRDFLQAAPHHAAYDAAFRFDGLASLEGITRPLHVATRADDLLFPDLDRVPERPGLTVARLGTDRAAWARHVASVLAGFAGREAMPPAGTDLAWSPDGALGVDGDDLLVRAYGTGQDEAVPLLLVHDTPGGAWEWTAVARREAARRRVIVPELPGHGLSPALTEEAEPLRTLCERLLALLDRQGFATVEIAGRGLGAVVAHRLAREAPRRVARVVAVDPLLARGADISAMFPYREPDWHGGHLMAAWYEARDRLLYRPWCARTAERARPIGPGLDLGEVHGRFTSIVLADNDHLPLAHSALEEAEAVLGPSAVPTRHVLLAGDPDTAEIAAGLAGRGAEPVVVRYEALADAVVGVLRAR